MLLCARPAVALPLAIGIPKSFDTTLLDPRLLAYGLYASQTLKLNDGVKIRPWHMGSGGDLYMGVGTVVYANTFAVGYAGWGRSSVIQGDLRVGGTFGTKIQEGAWIHGAVIPDSTLTPMRLTFPAQNVAGNRSLFVESGQTERLASHLDYPRDVTVRAGGTLILRGGRFVFRSLVLNPTAKVLLETLADSGSAGGKQDSTVRIDVHGEFLVDRAVMDGEAYTASTRKVRPDGRSIIWCYSGTQELHLNGSTRFLGTLVAPNAKVSLSSAAGFQGSLWAKEVEIHQYNGNLQFLPFTADSRTADNDLDGLDDTLEFRLGTDPYLKDTDGDGYSDGLEYRGRGPSHLMGAIQGVTQASPGFAHSWGWALDTTRRDLFNPLRRDQFLRLLWQDSAEVRSMISPPQYEMRWDAGKQACVGGFKYEGLSWAQYDSAWSDSAYLDRLVEIFADPSDKPLVKSPHTARVPDYTVVLHLDAGPTAWRNLPTGMPRLGGGVIVSSGGLNTGRGPYDFDLNGDGRLDQGGDPIQTFECDGTTPRTILRPDERIPLLQKLFSGWSSDPFRDSWVVAIGFGSNGLGVVDQSIASGHIFVSAQTAHGVWGLRAVLLHEYGHTFGLPHFFNVANLVAEGVMCNSAIGNTFQRCHQVRGATWSDTRYCGPEPSKAGEFWMNGAMGDANPWMNVTWARNGNAGLVGSNQPTRLSDTVLYEDGGPVDRRTGFRKVRALRTMQDIRFSPGEHCDLRVDALLEYEGISICRNRHGELLPQRIPGTPIDWNQNGVIDLQPVNLWGASGEDVIPWFMYYSETKGGEMAFTRPLHQDRNDWAEWIKHTPFIGTDEIQNNDISPFLVGENDRRVDLKRKVSW